MSLIARNLEAAGIATVVVGSALDIMNAVGVPRGLFVDTPLGNPVGPPNDADTQRLVLSLALDLAASATAPRTIVQAPVTWPSNEWRENYMHVGDDNRAELAAAGEARREQQRARRVERNS